MDIDRNDLVGDDGTDDDQSRRAFLLRIAKGVTYSSPVIYTLAAPSTAAAQVSGPPMMMTICDYFPVLCDWLMMFGAEEAGTITPTEFPGSTPPTAELPTAPWDRTPPGGMGMGS